MATPFQVEIVTPERVLFSGEAEEVSMRTEEGEIAFLAHHEDFIGAADVTVVRIATVAAGAQAVSGPQPSGGGSSGADVPGEVRVAVHGGFVHVEQDANTVRILAGVAELASEIDVDRARRALEAAEAAMASEPSGGTAAGADPDEPDVVRPTGLALAMLAPDAPEAAARRARVRLEAAQVSVST